MKISLTLAEIKELAAREYVLPDVFDLEIVDAPQEETDDGWISNVGRTDPNPPSHLLPDTKVEVKFRNGNTDNLGTACYWDWSCAPDVYSPHAIVEYRILKD
jgi:hypothetical protein